MLPLGHIINCHLVALKPCNHLKMQQNSATHALTSAHITNPSTTLAADCIQFKLHY